jgi:ATP-dependent RNA helicase RhlE
VLIEKTPFEEKQAQAREIDMQKRKENPEFKGAFHEKKAANKKVNKAGKSKTASKRATKGNMKRKR